MYHIFAWRPLKFKWVIIKFTKSFNWIRLLTSYPHSFLLFYRSMLHPPSSSIMLLNSFFISISSTLLLLCDQVSPPFILKFCIRHKPHSLCQQYRTILLLSSHPFSTFFWESNWVNFAVFSLEIVVNDIVGNHSNFFVSKDKRYLVEILRFLLPLILLWIWNDNNECSSSHRFIVKKYKEWWWTQFWIKTWFADCLRRNLSDHKYTTLIHDKEQS